MQTTVINDFGQKIGGAKKDLARNAMELIGFITNDALAKQPLSKSFPRPDFTRMFREGLISSESAIRLQFLYDNIPTKPRNPYGVKKWVEKTMSIIQTIKCGLDNENSLESQPYWTHVKFKNFQKEMNAAKWPQEHYSPYPFRIGYPYEYSSDKSFIVIKGDRIKFRSHDIENCVAWIKENAGIEKKVAKLQCVVYRNRMTDKFYITPKGKSGIVLKEFETKNEAFDFFKNNHNELVEIYKKLRDIPEERRDWNRPREGKNYRLGEDINPEQFSSMFPFRGVEFGNWVTQLERAASLNEAYDALLDLANMIGVAPEEICLDSQLALAFGARGSGKASAHYEAVKKVINLTKKKGAGSLAHEWFHALDNYLCFKEGEGLLFSTDNPTIVKNENISNALLKLRAKIKQTEFYSRSQKIDEYKSKPYWATMIELTARAFEKYVITKLSEKGHINDYLANIKSLEDFGRSDVYPYPTDEEIKLLVPLYDEVIASVFNSVLLQQSA